MDWDQIKNPQLDIVGIVAILGEGSTLRNAQASALGWHHVLPRLLPAPQALLKPEHERRLPTVPGTAVGAYSGNIQFELNFFCQLLHPDDLLKNEVQLVKVRRRKRQEAKGTELRPTAAHIRKKLRGMRQKAGDDSDSSDSDDEHGVDATQVSTFSHQAYRVNKYGPLALLSILGSCLSVGMIIGSVLTKDGYALLATVLLSLTSTVGGFASSWRLDLKQDPPKGGPREERQAAIPDSDVVIFYPRQGAFRIIRCSEEISRLYFRTEGCQYVLGENTYRIFALVATVLLMFGLLSMGNSQNHMKIAFALVYIVLNILYWGVSALNPVGPRGHWRHDFKCKKKPIVMPDMGRFPRAPQSRGTQESFLNTPVVRHDKVIQTEDKAISSSPSSISGGNVLDKSVVKDKEAHHPNSMRQRKVTFHEPDEISMSGSAVVTSPHRGRAREDPDSISHARTSPKISPKPQRQATQDVEGLRNRVVKPLGSLRDKITSWLPGGHQTTSNSHAISTEADPKPYTFATALWTAIAVTGSARWLNSTHIAPDNEVWATWIAEAGTKAAPYINDQGQTVSACTVDHLGRIRLPAWDHQGRLSELFHREPDVRKRRPPRARELYDVVMIERLRRQKVKGISPSIEFKLRREARLAKERAAARRRERVSFAASASTARRHSLLPLHHQRQPLSLKIPRSEVGREFLRSHSVG